MTTNPPKPPSMFEMLLSASASAAQAKAESVKPPWPPNPFPKGMRTGSTTERVLELLQREYPKHLEHGQIRFFLAASRGMVTWALRYLESHGLVERLHDPRNPTFRRWRVIKEGLREEA